MKLNVSGIDPSFRHSGMAKGTFETTLSQLAITDISLIDTSKAAGKVIRVNSDDLRCGSIITTGYHEWISGSQVVFAEIPIGSQSAASMKGLGIVTGILSGIGHVGTFKGKVIQVTPAEAKMIATGSKNASKTEMISWAMEKYPHLAWNTHKFRGRHLPNADNEHMADAIATIEAGLKTDQFQTLLAMLGSFSEG